MSSEKRLNNIDLNKLNQTVQTNLKRAEECIENMRKIQETLYFSCLPAIILEEVQNLFRFVKEEISNALLYIDVTEELQKLLAPIGQKLQEDFSRISHHFRKIFEAYIETLKGIAKKLGIEDINEKTIRELSEEIYARVKKGNNPANLTEVEEIVLTEIIAFFEEEVEQEETIASKPANLILFDAKQSYIPLPQNKPLNILTFLLTDKSPKIDLLGKATLEKEDFALTIENYEELKRRTSAIKLLDALIIAGKNQDSTFVRIPLKDYMNLRGIKHEEKARKQIEEDIELLKRVEFKFKDTKRNWVHVSIYGGVAGIQRGVIIFRFTPEFFALIPKDRYAYLPIEYFQTNDKRNPHTAYFIKKIALHKRMNLGKPNEDIISVKSLLEASPLFPKGEELEEKAKRHFTQLILEPFERDMDAIKTFKWHYIGEQPFDFLTFINSKVAITWIDYPDTVKLVRKKKKSITK